MLPRGLYVELTPLLPPPALASAEQLPELLKQDTLLLLRCDACVRSGSPWADTSGIEKASLRGVVWPPAPTAGGAAGTVARGVESPLHWAAESGHKVAAEAVLKKAAETGGEALVAELLTAKRANGDTPLMAAARVGASDASLLQVSWTAVREWWEGPCVRPYRCASIVNRTGGRGTPFLCAAGAAVAGVFSRGLRAARGLTGPFVCMRSLSSRGTRTSVATSRPKAAPTHALPRRAGRRSAVLS